MHSAVLGVTQVRPPFGLPRTPLMRKTYQRDLRGVNSLHILLPADLLKQPCAQVMTRRHILVSLDGSVHSQAAMAWTLRHLLRGRNYELHLAAVLPPLVYSVVPIAPLATGAAVAAMTANVEQQKERDEEEAREVLAKAKAAALAAGVDKVHTHLLPAAGGASGVAESIVQFIKAAAAMTAVLGTRGLGAVKRYRYPQLRTRPASVCVHMYASQQHA